MTITVHEGLGRRMRERREQLGMTRKTLAARLQIRELTIEDWERGMGIPSPSFHQLLANALDVTVGYLVDGTGEPPAPPAAAPAQEQPSETTQPVVQWPYTCTDCGRGMDEHGVYTDGLTNDPRCLFCAKKRDPGLQECRPQVDPAPAPTKRTRRPRKSHEGDRAMVVTSEKPGPEITDSLVDETQAPTERVEQPAPVDQAPTWERLLAEYRDLYTIQKAFNDETDAKLKRLKAQLEPLFSDECQKLHIEGFSLTRVVSERESFDVKRAMAERPALAAVLANYRSVSSSVSYRATVEKVKVQQ